MSPVLALGPIALPLPVLVAFAAIGFGLLAGLRAGRTAGTSTARPLLRTLFVGLLAARLGHVVQWREAFMRDPVNVLNLFDGGWEVGVGVAVAFLYGLSLVKQDARLKRPLLRAGAVASFLGVAGTIAGIAWPGEPPRLPALSLQTLEGQAVSLDRFAGKPVVVNLWATWCPPCRREMPLFEQAQASYEDVDFVFLNQGESAEKVERFLNAQGLSLGNVLLDPSVQAGNHLGRLALPTTLFFDRRGRLVSSRIGEIDAQGLQQRVERAMQH